MTSNMTASRQVDVIRAQPDDTTTELDCVAVEEALEIRLEGQPFSVIMRTPGADQDLAIGFLFSEGVIRSADDVRFVETADSSRINVRLSRSRAEILPDLLDKRRPVAMNSSCGLCGRQSLESLVVEVNSAAAEDWSVSQSLIVRLPATLRASQRTFA